MLRINRRELIVGASAALLLARSGAAWAADEFVVGETQSGKVRGVRVDGVQIYRGIPYAGPTSGANRFRPAPPLQSWSGVRDALIPGVPSIQPPGGTYGINEPAERSEDCQTLTVWTPANDGKRRPVMVYNHGGGFTTGSAASVAQDGAQLARLYDVVVVATNHRLGLLGYLYLGELGGEDYAGSGNQGMLDIVDGLKWVSRNIEAFGGDPNNVMVFGESGGGAKTSAIYAMPSAAPLFNKASIESGPGIRMMRPESAAATTRAVLAELGIAPGDWRKLLEVPAATLLGVQMKLAMRPQQGNPMFGDRKGLGGDGIGGFGPVVDGKALAQDPFNPEPPAFSRSKPLIVGHNRDESNFFALFSGDVAAFNLDEAALKARLQKENPEHWETVLATYRSERPGASPAELYCAINSDRFAGTGSTVIAERKAAQGAAPVYRYIFTYQLETTMPGAQRPLGAMHALEIAFKFNNMDNVRMGNFENLAGARPERIAAGRNMSEMWATFARTGKPGAAGQPAWPAYTVARRDTMLIDSQCTVVSDPHAAERKMWEKIG